ncbi:ADC synthase [Mycena amicta]|nr:ADC synthase [Mycena amicta]
MNRRILLIDSYDSFTFNLASLCKQAIPGCSIFVVHNDDLTISQLLPYLSAFDALVVGPGPGSPQNDSDIGIIKHLWNLDIPIFGVCLGLQSLGFAFGARVERLKVVKHGQISLIHHSGGDIFQGVGAVEAVRYHSLHVVLPLDSSQLEEIAWTDDKGENGRVVMAIRHRSKPLWAVQYHPESVRTRGGGLEVLQNFWRLAQSWNIKTGRVLLPWCPNMTALFPTCWPSLPLPSNRYPRPPEDRPRPTVQILHLPSLATATVCELFGVDEREDAPFVLLDSAAHPGRYSIIGSLTATSLQILYYVPDDHVTLVRGQHIETLKLERDIWSWLADFMAEHRLQVVDPDIPFAGGLVGMLSYELGVHGLGVPLIHRHDRGERYPDVNMVFVERSVVIDSVTGQVYVQSILEDDPWIADTANIFKNTIKPVEPLPTVVSTSASVVIPDKAQYIARIDAAKEYISSGDSYELCLTARTSITIPKAAPVGSASWRRYKTLRSRNPAPYSAYIRLHPTTVLSSSPERFMSTSRPPNPVFHLRPIKGTVRKAPGITRKVAEEMLAGSVKEVAENLMIVDLIRHDLHSIVGEDVQVKQFCRVEEYETVWQLVSVIEGRLEQGCPEAQDPDSQLGWEMLRRSLPPGSMTGAPKKRSVEILQRLENSERNLYSGVFGYWCVGGGSDWSVAIRSCFKLNRSTDTEADSEEWHIGAGGAITALSDPEAEWDEMLAKLHSTIIAFQ